MRTLSLLVLVLLMTGCPEPSDSCGNDAACVTCTPENVALPHTVSGDDFMADYPDNTEVSMGRSCVQSEGAEAVFEVSLEAGQMLAVSMEQQGQLSGKIHVKEVCDTTSECLASVNSLFSGDRLEFIAPASGDYVVLVESDVEGVPYTIRMDTVALELCGDGVDNDGDGLTDCDDRVECFDTPECPPECAEEILATLPIHVRGADFNEDFADTFGYGEGRDCVASSGSEAIYTLELTVGQTVTVTQSGVVWLPLFLHVKSDCSPYTECIESQRMEEDTDFTAPASGSYTFVLEGTPYNQQYGPYQINIGELAPEVCSDGLDNDLDGLTDCDDTLDCFDSDACPFTCPTTEPDYMPLVFVDNEATISADDFDSITTWLGPYELDPFCYSPDGNSVVHEVGLAAGENLVITETGDKNLVWHVLSTCAPFGRCLASTQDDNPGELYVATADETVFLVAQGEFLEEHPGSIEATVRIGVPEVCGNGEDEDLDGQTDCEDFDCFDLPECLFECSGINITAELFGGGFSASGTSFVDDFPRVFPEDWFDDAGEDCVATYGAQALFSVDLQAGEGVRLSVPSDLNLVLSAAPSCLPGTPCIVSLDTFGSGPTDVSFVAQRDGEYALRVESRFTGDSSYSFDAELLPMENCDNGMDDNEDGNVDCFDVGCDCVQECPAVQALPIELQGDDFAAAFNNVRNFADEEGCTGPDGVDAVFTVALDEGEGLLVRESQWQPVFIRVLDDCVRGEACLEQSSSNLEELRFVAPSPGDYTVVIEQRNEESGPFDILIESFEDEDCPDGPNQTLDGIDNDLDGLIDCFDPDCYDEVLCPVECLPTVSDTVRVRGNDWGGDFVNRVDYSDREGCLAGYGAEVSYSFELAAGDVLRLLDTGPSTLGSTGYLLRVLEDCSPTAACLEAVREERLLDFVAPADGVYTAVVESRNSGFFGVEYSFVIGVVEDEICDDGIDNDLDNATDGDDDDC